MIPHDDSQDREQEASARPQSLMLSFLGIHVLNRGVAVFSGSVIDVFARVGVSEDAVRSTLTRMVKRDLLARHRVGRRTYFGLTARSTAVLEDGEHRVWRSGAINSDWDGAWTVVGFSVPESWRSQRHDLRSRLIWGGFGPLQNGLWVAPGVVDVPALVEDLELDDHLKVFTAHTAKPTEAEQIARTAFDVPAIAERYQVFLRRWDHDRPLADAPDDLARQLLLHTEWLQLVRQDPRLPAEHLPEDWPAIRAEQVFQALAGAYVEPAASIAASVLDTIPVDGP
ncbi:PaaX family transcriptional regulator [Saccharothrix luteola]|uniref:PaaX family transcriptional regulator n=1 Tax=Saccharothrix luteola TaxID=2893018 RepID=UPI001E4AB21B|nr:PaaX family transcriptional regulator C-terminal domain-containing protein [Saccharothrix luteola]MCC8246787.1 PaaX family transcriptional regulator [Saccharothrix luteola]